MSTLILSRNVPRTAPAKAAETPKTAETPKAAETVFLFPGQSSVGPDILLRARAAHPAAEAIADRARAVLGEARASRYLDGRGVQLDRNRDTQIAVFLATQMYLAALGAEHVEADRSLGLSLGEYSHLVHIGALDLDDVLRLVDERGRCYDEAPPGIMAAVLAADYDTVASVVHQARVHGPIAISNVNAPTQHVIAGAEPAVSWAAAALEDEHAAHVTIIERRVPMHSPMMAPVARAFAPALSRAPWKTATTSYLPNVTGTPIAHPTAADFVAYLTRHVAEPVLWQHSIDRLISAGRPATFLEVGPGGVLHNMMSRAWRGVRCARVDAVEGIDPREHFAATVGAWRA
jgi:[acyl-carrier-protein] S-malonyltransferase